MSFGFTVDGLSWVPGGDSTTCPSVTHRAEGQSLWLEVDFGGCALERGAALGSAQPPPREPVALRMVSAVRVLGHRRILNSWAPPVPAQGWEIPYPKKRSLRVASFPLLREREELPFPHRGRVVQTFELKEENVTCPFVSFLEADKAGAAEGQMWPPRLLALCASLPPARWRLLGELDSEPGWGWEFTAGPR